MKVFGLPSILAFTAVFLAAAGCAGTSAAVDSHADHIKDMVMNRYNGFAEAGGESCDK